MWQHACSHLRASMGVVTDQKANRALTALYLQHNRVGPAGAAALADALQATVLSCGHTTFQECASCCHRCCFAVWCEQLASPICCAVFVFFSCVSKENVAWRGVLFANCSQVDVALVQNRTGLIECLVIGICLVAARHQRVSFRIVAARCVNNNRGAVCQGITCRVRTWHWIDMTLRFEESGSTVDTTQHVVARENVLTQHSRCTNCNVRDTFGVMRKAITETRCAIRGSRVRIVAFASCASG